VSPRQPPAVDRLLELLLLRRWSPYLTRPHQLNVVAWSLSCEALFYFCFPFIMKLINKVRPERLLVLDDPFRPSR